MRDHISLESMTKAAALVLLLAAAGCGPMTPAERAAEQALRGDNGFSPNGLSQNGLSQNGLSQNGLSQNGLSQNGLSQNGFSTWFGGDPAAGDMVMRYLVKCAAASGESRTWTDPGTGLAYTWPGELGLAPSWAGGTPATELEQQVVSACLAAHVNAYSVSVPISVSGYAATGAAIKHYTGEWDDFPLEEGAFFGNLFDGSGVFVCQKHAPFAAGESSVRACAFDTSVKGPSRECSPMVNTGDCSAVCSAWRTKDHAWQQCSWNGVTYKPVSTRIRSLDVYACGDGVCQVTETPYDSTTGLGCKADCGQLR